MKFSELLAASIGRSEIPLRFEPGAEESVAKPVIEFLRAWLEAHLPDSPQSDFDYGQKALIQRLIEELEDATDIPV